MLIGRFLMIVPMLAIAGSLAAKKIVPASAGTFPTDGALFVGLLVGVILIVGGLTFFPALALGPIVEHFADERRHPVLQLRTDHGTAHFHSSGGGRPSPPLVDPSDPRAPRVLDAFSKLDPRRWSRNPVMFVVEVVARLTTVLFIRDLVTGPQAGSASPSRSPSGSGSRCCSPTSPRRSPRAAARPRPRPCAGPGPKPSPSAWRTSRTPSAQIVPATQLRKGDVVLVEAGDLIPSDGEVIEGVASVDESAITGESAPVIRESGGDRSAVTGGTRVLSDWIKVRITAEPGDDLPRPHDRAGRGRQAPEDAERDRAQRSCSPA